MASDARKIGLFPATMLVAGNMIGAGIFMMPFLRNPYLAAASTITMIWLSAGLNMIGPRLVTRFETWTTLLGIGPIAFVGIAGWYSFDPAVFAAGWNPTGTAAATAVSSAVSIMFWSFMGVESASVAAAIVKNPERNVARATMAGVTIAAVIYVLSTTAIMGIIPNDELRHSTAPFADAALRVLGPTGAVLITICAIV